VVEYGAAGNLPLVPAKNIGITTNDVTAPSDPGGFTLTGSSPRSSDSATFSWTASSDAGSGLANPAYRVERSLNGGAYTLVTTTNSLSVTSLGLSDGAYTYRVRASDAQGNASNWVSASVVIDMTAPAAPGTPSTASPTNNATPTWSWSAASDGSGAGLASPAYAVQWSQSPGFASGVTSDTSDTAGFTQPSTLSDGTWYLRVKATDKAGNASGWSGVGSVVVDSAAPLISNIAVPARGDSSAAITWTTDKATNSRVRYGPTAASYDTQTAVSDQSPRVVSHRVDLSDLVSCTKYYFQVVSTDASGNTALGAGSYFFTTGCAGGATFSQQTDAAAPAATGGSLGLSSNGTGVQVTAPAGFTGQDVSLQIKHLDGDAALTGIGMPTGMHRAGDYVYDIKALIDEDTAVTSFVRPVTVRIQYNDVDVAGLVESSLTIWRYDDGAGWSALTGCAVDEFLNTVTCDTAGFSTFALFGALPPVASSGGAGTQGDGRTTPASSPVTAADGPARSDEAATPSSGRPSADGGGAAGEAAGGGERHEAPAVSGWWRQWWVWVLALGFVWWILAMRRRRKKRNARQPLR
jgi:hypothetical protein